MGEEAHEGWIPASIVTGREAQAAMSRPGACGWVGYVEDGEGRLITLFAPSTALEEAKRRVGQKKTQQGEGELNLTNIPSPDVGLINQELFNMREE